MLFDVRTRLNQVKKEMKNKNFIAVIIIIIIDIKKLKKKKLIKD